MQKLDHGVPFAKTATHATSAVATVSGTANVSYYVTDVTGSSDKAGAIILVKDGTTVIWQDRVSNTTPYSHTFETALKVTAGADVSVTVDGTAYCASNISGVGLATT